MKTKTPKIVVLTPIKNEAWILDRFLSVTSQFADCIIIADQNSDDGSVEICKRYPKVILIKNKSEEYSEDLRQILLIQKARELVRCPKILLALDADEIMAADAISTLGWKMMMNAEPGTILFFEKPDLYLSTSQCIRNKTPSPLGYVDDLAEHKPKKIHSFRVPMPPYAKKLYIPDVKIVHYSLARPDAHRSKMRYYSAVENLIGTNKNISTVRSLFNKRIFYSLSFYQMKAGIKQQSPPEWFKGWEDIRVDMHTIPHQKYYWYDFEVLKYFNKHGVRRFWLDDIWEFDWEACRLHARSIGINDVPDKKISSPPGIIRLSISILTKFYYYLKKLKNRVIAPPPELNACLVPQD